MADNTEMLVERAKNGDSTAFDELYIAYKDRLRKFVLKQGISESDADDVVSDTFVEVMKHIGDLKSNEYFGTWLHKIALRKANELKEKSGRYQRIEFNTGDSEDSDLAKLGDDMAAVELAFEEKEGETIMLPSDYAEAEDIKQLIAEQINSLGSDQREALYLYYYENKSVAEISEMTGATETNVKARLFHARKKLKTKLEELQKKGIVLCAVPFGRLLTEFHSSFMGVEAAGAAAGTAAVTATGSATAGSAAAGASAASAATASAASAGATAATAAAATGISAKFIAIVASAVIAAGAGTAVIATRAGSDDKDSKISVIDDSFSNSEASNESALTGAEALQNANTVAKLVYTTAKSELADIVAEGRISAITKGGHCLELDSAPESELDKRVIDGVKRKGDYHGEIYFFVNSSTLKPDYALYRDTNKAYVGKYPDPNIDITKDIDWPDDVGGTTSAADNSSAAEQPEAQKTQTPLEYFNALSAYNSDKVKWSREAISDDMLNSGASGVFYFCNESLEGGSIELVMQNGKYIQYRNTTDISESAEYSFEESKKIAYEMFRDYIYVAFPDMSKNDLDVVIKQIEDWAEAITIDDVDKGNDKRTFTIGDEAVNISYILANGKEYGGFRCTIDL